MATRAFVTVSLMAFAASAAAEAIVEDPDVAPIAPPDDTIDCSVPLPPPSQDLSVEFPPFTQVRLLSPPQVTDVPLNAELILAGNRGELAAGFWRVDVFNQGSGERLEAHLDENDPDIVVLDELLPPDSAIIVRVEPSSTNPCPGCFFAQDFLFFTGADVDVEAPVLDASAFTAHGFVLPSPEQQQQCGVFSNDRHVIETRLTSDESLLFTIGARSARNAPVLLANRLATQGTQNLSLSLGNDVVFALGESFIVVVTARDLAGNVAEPIVQRHRMRSFRDRVQSELTPIACDLDARPVVTAPQRLSKNAGVRVVFPFEELPVGLRPVAGGDVVPLVPVADVVEDARVGGMFQTARAIDPGAYDVVTLACPSCVCADCTPPLRRRITLDDVVDQANPAKPVVRDVLDDPAPALSEGACVPDDAATWIVLAPAEDDVAGAADLFYDAVVKVDGDLPRPAGTGLPALRRANGDVVVRLSSGAIGRLAAQPFELTLTARDAAGHTSQTTYNNPGDVDEAAGGCAAAGAGSVLLLLPLLRRRRR